MNHGEQSVEFVNLLAEYVRVRTLDWVVKTYPIEAIGDPDQFLPEAKIYIVAEQEGPRPALYATYIERPSGASEPAEHELPILLQVYPISVSKSFSCQGFLELVKSADTSPLSLGQQRRSLLDLGDLTPWIVSLRQEVDRWTAIAVQAVSHELTYSHISELSESVKRYEMYEDRMLNDFTLTHTVGLFAEVFGRYYDDRLLDPKKTDLESLLMRQRHLEQLHSALSQMKKELPR